MSILTQKFAAQPHHFMQIEEMSLSLEAQSRSNNSTSSSITRNIAIVALGVLATWYTGNYLFQMANSRGFLPEFFSFNVNKKPKDSTESQSQNTLGKEKDENKTSKEKNPISGNNEAFAPSPPRISFYKKKS